MRGRPNQFPKMIDLNINIEEGQSRYGSTPLESFRQETSHRQKPFPQLAFTKNERSQDKNDKENNCFSNFQTKKKKVFEGNEFNSTLKKEDNSYIKTLRGVIKKELFKKEKSKIIVINESRMKAKTSHLGDMETTIDEEERLSTFQNFNRSFLFELKNCKKILGYLNFLDLLNFQYVCKRTFSSEFKSFIKSRVCQTLIKVKSCIFLFFKSM